MSADILHSFAECLRAAGLEVEAVQSDGLLHRCGTAQAPSQGWCVQGVSGYSCLHLVEELAHGRRRNMDIQVRERTDRRRTGCPV